MRTDVFAHERMVAAAVDAARQPDGTVTADAHLAAIDETTVHSVELRFARELTADELVKITDAAFVEFDAIEIDRDAEPRAVHGEIVETTSTVRTFDPDVAEAHGLRAGKPTGDDIVPERRAAQVDGATGAIEVVVIPETRTPYWEFAETVRVQAVTTCPDCTRGLVSRADGMICSSLSRDVPVRACHVQCVVACGRPR